MKRKVTLILTAVTLVVVVAAFSMLLFMKGPAVVRSVMDEKSLDITIAELDFSRLNELRYIAGMDQSYQRKPVQEEVRVPCQYEKQLEQTLGLANNPDWYFESTDKRKCYLCYNEDLEYIKWTEMKSEYPRYSG